MQQTDDWQARTNLLIGSQGVANLKTKHILVAGLGGVGAMAAEMICRMGVGRMTIVDADIVHPSNRNRQLCALVSTQGRPKTEIMKARLLDINPEMELNVENVFLKDDKIHELLETPYDFVVDAIDTLSPKVFFLFHTFRKGYPIVSSMGAGAKTDPSQIRTADISETHTCRLAYYIRKHLTKIGVRQGIRAVFSTELPDKSSFMIVDEQNKRTTVGTVSYMPAMFGCYCASEVFRGLVSVRSNSK